MCLTLNSAAEWAGSMFQVLSSSATLLAVAIALLEGIGRISF
jgi:hypothetical protein